jgi:hypothetical protein
MTFLITISVLLVFDVSFLLYLVNSEFFGPAGITGQADIWNISVFTILVSTCVGLLVTLIVYLVEKFIYCGLREFPKSFRAIKYGLLATVVFGLLVIGIMLLG